MFWGKVRNHFGIGRISQAGALAALQDKAYLADVQTRVARARDRLSDVARSNGCVPLPSATNFVTMDVGGDSALARDVLSELLDRDVFVRMPGVAPLDRCIRVSCASDDELDVFAKALPEALAAARGRDRDVA